MISVVNHQFNKLHELTQTKKTSIFRINLIERVNKLLFIYRTSAHMVVQSLHEWPHLILIELTFTLGIVLFPKHAN